MKQASRSAPSRPQHGHAQGERWADGAGARVAENDNWPAGLAPTFTAIGAFVLSPGSRDAALLTTLQTGSYTVQVRGVDDGTGEALVEIYEVP